jgi:hypothetical protein
LNNRAVKVALMNNQTDLSVQNPFDNGVGVSAGGYVDMIGAINTDGTDYINGYETAKFTGLSKQRGIRRKSLDDKNNNSTDFERITYANLVTKSGGVITVYSDDYEVKRPKNHTYGAWNPITGVKE